MLIKQTISLLNLQSQCHPLHPERSRTYHPHSMQFLHSRKSDTNQRLLLAKLKKSKPFSIRDTTRQ
nr:hypothetical protein [Prevotella sp. P5-92]